LSSRSLLRQGGICALVWVTVRCLFTGSFDLMTFVCEAAGVFLFYLVMAGLAYAFVERPRDSSEHRD